MIVLCIGSTQWTERQIIRSTLLSLGTGPHLVVSGQDDGAMDLSIQVAEELGYRAELIFIEGELSDMALFLRDVKMLELHPDLERIYIFHDDPDHSVKCRRIVAAARQKKIWTANVRSDGATYIAVQS
jgi:hypothetical protein